MAKQEAGPTGALAWFPWGRQQDLPGWRFDVITLLAVIGESSVAEHVQTLTASKFCLLPRIIPAPQALLRPSRPQRLPEVTAKMSGVYGGVVLDTVGFFANIIHPLEDFKPFAFQVLEIKHTPRTGRQPSAAAAMWALVVKLGARMGMLGRAEPTAAPTVAGEEREVGGANGTGESKTVHCTETNNPADIEQGLSATGPSSQPASPSSPIPSPQRRPTMKKLTDFVSNTMANTEDYTVPPATYSPVHVLSVLSFLLTVGLLIAAGIWEDGTAMLAIVLISLAGTVVCYASWWQPILMSRRTNSQAPPGDVVIRTREGAFILIKCTEEVARELYSGTEECRYVSTTKWHKVFMGLGMVLLMVAVVLLGNCGWNSQVFIGGSYIALNALYWAMSLLKQKHFWDLARYEVRDKTPADARNAHEVTDKNDPKEGTPSFTRTLWYAVRETGHGAWVERSGALPGTHEWNTWLKEAIGEAQRKNRGWGAVKKKDDLMKEAQEASEQASVKYDAAEQSVPFVHVQPPRRRDTQRSML